MSKKAGKTPYIVAFTLIIRDAQGRYVNGTGSRGGIEYAKRFARSLLHSERHCVELSKTYATVDIYSYCSIPWQELQPVATVTLDDEEAAHE